VLPPPPPQPLTSTMAANRTREGARYANFLPETALIAAHAWPALSLDLLLAIVQNTRDSSARKPATGNRFMGLRGDEGGTADDRAVVVTPILTIVGVDPDTFTGVAGPVQVAFVGAPLQVMVTLSEPLPPVSAS